MCERQSNVIMHTPADESEGGQDADNSIKEQEANKQTTWAALAPYASLGIIYVDIGTSPLYTYATTLASSSNSSSGPLLPAKEDVLGVASLIFWIMTLVVLVKYVLIVLRADDSGEGGTFALYSLLCRSIGLTPFGAKVHQADCILSRYNSMPRRRRTGLDATVSCLTSYRLNTAVRRAFRRSAALQMVLLLTVVLATAMVVGDGILTPSIFMLGAVAGLQVATDSFISEDVVVGISVAVLVLLFITQSYDTSLVGRILAPTVIIWLSLNAGVGIYNLAVNGGEIFTSLNPWQIVNFFARNGRGGWLMLGGVVLCITGAEAMYADLGHFTRRSVSLGFIAFVYPTLMLTYWGQGAHLLNRPEDAHKVFWEAMPQQMFWPMFVSAVLASTAASQALITGAFSIMRQATMLGLFPKLTVQHTGHGTTSQVYMPEVNWSLMVLTVAVTAGFRSSDRLKEAYGVAVMTVMTVNTGMLALVMLVTWNTHPLLVVLFVAVYLPIEGAFLSATLVKVASGGWVALAVAAVLSTIKLTWWWGTSKKHNHVRLNQAKLHSLLKEDAEPQEPSYTQQQQQQQQQPQALAGAAGTNSNKSSHSALCRRRSSADAQHAEQHLFHGCSHHPLAAFQPQHRRVLLQPSGEAVARMPGLGVYYSESSAGVPAVMKHVLGNMPALYSSMVFLTVRFVAVPTVTDEERFLAWRDKSISGCYHAVVRYGYMDRVQHSEAFMEALVQTLLQQVLERKGVGRPGAAQRLLAALTDKAAEGVAAAGKGLGTEFCVGLGTCARTRDAVVKVQAKSQVREASADGTCSASSKQDRPAGSGGGSGMSTACSSGIASIAQAIAAAKAVAEAAGSMAKVSEAAVAADGGRVGEAPPAMDAVAALLEKFTADELLEVLTPASAHQRYQQKQQKQQLQQQQQQQQTWSIKARASLTQQQQQPQNDMKQLSGEQVAAVATVSAGNSGEVLACIMLSVSGGPASSAGKQSAATAASAITADDSVAGVCPTAALNATAQSTSEVAHTSSAAAGVVVAPLQKGSSFLSGLRQRASFRLAKQANEETHRPDSSSQAIQQAQSSSAAGREPNAGQGSAGALGRPSYWGQLRKGHAPDSDGESDSADGESADLSGPSWPDSKQPLPQQQQQQQHCHTEEAAEAAEATGQYMNISNSIEKSGSYQASGTTFKEEEQDAAAAAAGELVLSQAQLVALHEAAQLLQAYQRRWVHCVGRTTLKVLPGGSIHRKLLGGLYSFLAVNSRPVTAAWSIPTSNLIELGMDVEV